MKGFLVDTNVLSEFGRSAPPPNPGVKAWLESTPPDSLFASVLSLGEIRKGIELLQPGKKRFSLERWLTVELNGWFGDNLLPVNQAISDRWGLLTARAQERGRSVGNIDGLLAATAIEHDLTVATRNVRHFEGLGATIFNPWES